MRPFVNPVAFESVQLGSCYCGSLSLLRDIEPRICASDFHMSFLPSSFLVINGLRSSFIFVRSLSPAYCRLGLSISPFEGLWLLGYAVILAGLSREVSCVGLVRIWVARWSFSRFFPILFPVFFRVVCGDNPQLLFVYCIDSIMYASRSKGRKF